MLELSSAQPGDLHAMNAMKLREVLPLFSMAVKRSMEELNTRIQAIIKEQCTAIHPAVEWRFRQAAMAGYSIVRTVWAMRWNRLCLMTVYPLYGVSDIRARRRNAMLLSRPI